jgi:two-component system, cell cycle sensor histidine kinase and response regulator CckA
MPETGKGNGEGRELAELRSREASYRERLVQQAALAERLGSCTRALQRMLRDRPPLRAQLSQTLLEVAKLSSQALDVERTSIWLFDASHQQLRCTTLLVRGDPQDVRSLSLDSRSCPRYCEALADAHALAVEDVHQDARTAELQDYLSANEIGALLDVPVIIPGELLGVVCHEHVGGPRTWYREEVDFAANAGGLVALALETERRLRAEQLALGTEARYQHLVESLPVTVYAFEATGRLSYVSPNALALTGWPAQRWLEAGADEWINRVHEEDRPGVVARFQPGALSGEPKEINYRLEMPDGKLRWVRDTCRHVRNPVGRTIALQGVLCDVTQQVETALERSELIRRQRSMLDHAQLHAVMTDAQGLVTYVNEYFCRVTGYERELVIGRSWFDLTTPEPERARVARELQRALSHGEIEARVEAPLRSASGERLHVLWSNTVLRGIDGQVQGVLGLGVDMTQRIRLEQELLQQTKLESLGRLAAGVAHDFNNLLTVMVAETQRLSRAGDASTSESAEQGLRDALQQARDLTHSLLVYGRAEAKREEALAIDKLVGEAMPLARAIAGADIDTTCSLHGGGAYVRLDHAQLKQVLLNLVGNAADATRERSMKAGAARARAVHVETHLEFLEPVAARRAGAIAGGEFVVLSVADEGCGMDTRQLSRIFEPFYTTKSQGQGTGLGLPLCQSIIARAGGFIEVQSEIDQGTRFRVYLPRLGREPSPAAEPMRVSAVPGLPNAHVRILVVDDIASIRNMLVTTLLDAGYRAFAAESLATAAQVLGSQAIDLLITDGSLPDGSGVVLARSARSVRPELKVVLASGSLEADPIFDAVLLKPFDSSQLLAVVAELMGEPVLGSVAP